MAPYGDLEDRGCKPGQLPLDSHDWIDRRFTRTCFWYPMRDCPGWDLGGTCNRLDKPIPLDIKDIL